MTRYIACKFRDSDTRTYTYHYEGGEPLSPGDKVRVPDRTGDGYKVVIVADVDPPPPDFTTKPIIGRHVDEDEGDLFGD